jgi:DNA repair protein RadC
MDGLAQTQGPRERLNRLGADALTDAELLAVLMGTGTKGLPVIALAQRLLLQSGGLKSFATKETSELCGLPGMGPARAAAILAALELGRRAMRAEETRPKLSSPRDIYDYLVPVLSTLRREKFHVLAFNSRNVLLSDTCVARGTANTCPVDPRDVFSAALDARATAVVFAHNHPSGDPSPSTQDVSLTQQLVKGASLLGIRVLDHLVIGDGAFVSFAERGLLALDDAERPSASRGARVLARSVPLTSRRER